MLKIITIGLMITSINSFAKDLPKALLDLNGNFELERGDSRCDTNISVWGYENLSINLEANRDVYFNNINEGRTSGRCMDGIGSKDVFQTTFLKTTLTSFISQKSIGCFAPKGFAKLDKESEVVIHDKNTFSLTTLMRSDKPIKCTYKRI